jgi:hypothetical protein
MIMSWLRLEVSCPKEQWRKMLGKGWRRRRRWGRRRRRRRRRGKYQGA